MLLFHRTGRASVDRIVHALAQIGEFASTGVDIDVGRVVARGVAHRTNFSGALNRVRQELPESSRPANLVARLSGMQEYPPPVAQPLNQASLEAYVGSQSYWSQLQVLAETASTNADLVAMANDVPGRAVCTAEWQTAGRGRLDRTWEQGRSRGLATSFLLRPAVPVTRWGWIPLLSALAVLDVCAEFDIDATLKWPNDVLAATGPRAGAKFGGILTHLASTSPPAVVVGIGLNVLETPSELPPTGTSLAQQAADQHLDRTAVLIALLAALGDRCAAWEAGADVAADYRASCSTLGQLVSVTMPAATAISGIAQDIDEQGRLCVLADGRIHTVAAGDVVHVRRAE